MSLATTIIIRQLILEDVQVHMRMVGLKPEIWRMGGNRQAVGVRFGDHHAIICDYATENGELAALLMMDNDKEAMSIIKGTPERLAQIVKLWASL